MKRPLRYRLIERLFHKQLDCCEICGFRLTRKEITKEEGICEACIEYLRAHPKEGK